MMNFAKNMSKVILKELLLAKPKQNKTKQKKPKYQNN